MSTCYIVKGTVLPTKVELTCRMPTPDHVHSVRACTWPEISHDGLCDRLVQSTSSLAVGCFCGHASLTDTQSQWKPSKPAVPGIPACGRWGPRHHRLPTLTTAMQAANMACRIPSQTIGKGRLRRIAGTDRCHSSQNSPSLAQVCDAGLARQQVQQSAVFEDACVLRC